MVVGFFFQLGLIRVCQSEKNVVNVFWRLKPLWKQSLGPFTASLTLPVAVALDAA
jgi:hypothetical protein